MHVSPPKFREIICKPICPLRPIAATPHLALPSILRYSRPRHGQSRDRVW